MKNEEIMRMFGGIINQNNKTETDEIHKETYISKNNESIGFREKMNIKDLLINNNPASSVTSIKEDEEFEDICTFDPMKRSAGGLNENIEKKFSKLSVKTLSDRKNHNSLESLNDSVKYLSHSPPVREKTDITSNLVKSNSNQNNFTQADNNILLMSPSQISKNLFSIISNFKNQLLKTIMLLENLSEDLYSSNFNTDKYSHELCINTFIEVKENILKSLEKTEKDFSKEGIVYRNIKDDLKLSSSSFYGYTKERPFFDNSLLNLTKTSKVSHNESEHMKSSFDKTKSYIENIVQKSKDKVHELKEENKNNASYIRELKDYYAEVIKTSSNLVEELYKKNKQLKDKLIKYKKQNEEIKKSIKSNLMNY
jgi:hypothetical protein